MATRFFTAVLILSLAFVGVAAPASAQQQTPPTLLSSQRIDWVAGSSGWINLSWTSEVQLDNVEVRVIRQSAGLSVDYPNDAEFSSLMIDGTLSPNEVDFTALHVASDASVRGTKRALLEVSWDENGRRHEATGWLRFTNKTYKGDDFAILTEDAAVSVNPLDPGDNWVELAYKGLAPATTGMEISVQGPVDVYHPQGSYTSLHHDQTLHAGESDVARVWLDPELLEAGLFSLTVDVSYTTAADVKKTVAHDVTLLVSVDNVDVTDAAGDLSGDAES